MSTFYMIYSFFLRSQLIAFSNSILNNEEGNITNQKTITLVTAGTPAILNTKDEAANCIDPTEVCLHNPLMK